MDYSKGLLAGALLFWLRSDGAAAQAQQPPAAISADPARLARTFDFVSRQRSWRRRPRDKARASETARRQGWQVRSSRCIRGRVLTCSEYAHTFNSLMV